MPTGGWSGNLTSVAELTASDGLIGDRLGGAVAVSGHTVMGGATQNPYPKARGAAYVFVEPSGGWTNGTQTAKLTASDGAAYDWFGSSVAIQGNIVAVGAMDATGFRGSAYVYAKPKNGWATTSRFAAKLTASDSGVDDFFGSSVALGGGVVAVGSSGWPGNAIGAGYVFGKCVAAP
jgi:hypothetical protein